ncbi:MAG: hypothetical protein ACTHMM_05540 [Agriterribacter sp.]
MNRTELIMSEYKPIVALMVYKSNDNSYYLESHDVTTGGQILAGKPLLQETIQGMVDTFFDENKNRQNIGGLMPENLLFFKHLPGGNYKMVWYQPAGEQVLHFAPALKLKTGKAWVPAMIYVADSGDLDVYALKSNSRPKSDTKLFIAPFHNTGDDGAVCLGSAKVEKPKQLTYLNLMKYWESLFWLSEFTHLNGTNKTKSDMGKVWANLLKNNSVKWSDINELRAYEKLTLKNLLQ